MARGRSHTRARDPIADHVVAAPVLEKVDLDLAPIARLPKKVHLAPDHGLGRNQDLDLRAARVLIIKYCIFVTV